MWTRSPKSAFHCDTRKPIASHPRECAACSARRSLNCCCYERLLRHHLPPCTAVNNREHITWLHQESRLTRSFNRAPTCSTSSHFARIAASLVANTAALKCCKSSWNASAPMVRFSFLLIFWQRCQKHLQSCSAVQGEHAGHSAPRYARKGSSSALPVLARIWKQFV